MPSTSLHTFSHRYWPVTPENNMSLYGLDWEQDMGNGLGNNGGRKTNEKIRKSPSVREGIPARWSRLLARITQFWLLNLRLRQHHLHLLGLLQLPTGYRTVAAGENDSKVLKLYSRHSHKDSNLSKANPKAPLKTPSSNSHPPSSQIPSKLCERLMNNSSVGANTAVFISKTKTLL